MANNSRFTYIEPKDKFKKINMNVILKYDPVVVGIYSKLVTMSSGKSLSIDFLSKRLKVSKERMRKVIVFLEGEGYITREAIRNDEGRLDGWNYHLYAEPVSEDERTRAGMKAKKDSDSRVKDSPCYGFSDNTEKPEDIIIDNTISNNKIDNISSDINISSDKRNIENKRLSNDNQKDELFEKFWSDYGREGSKARALKEWNRLKDEDKKTVMSTLSSYLIYCKRIKRQKKDACSYLHQEYYKEDWNKIPDYYQIQPSDDVRLVKFKQYMVDRFKDLIYHRNPLTFEQTEELINDLGLTEFESVMDKLAQRDIHQYFSIFKGVETVLNEEA